MYDALCREWELSRHAIRDLEDEEGFVELVEGLVKANWGMDWSGFWECVEWNVRERQDEDMQMRREEETAIVAKLRARWAEWCRINLKKEILKSRQ